MQSTDDPTPPTPWRQDGTRIVLVGRRCLTCGKRCFSSARYCDQCRGDSFETVDLGDRGRLYSFSEVHIAPQGFKTPYLVGYVDIGEDVRIFAQIEGSAATLETGDTLVVILGPIRENENGEAIIGYKFRAGGPGDA